MITDPPSGVCDQLLKSAFRPSEQPQSSRPNLVRGSVRFAPLPTPSLRRPLSTSPQPSSLSRSPVKKPSRSHSGRTIPTVYAWIQESPVCFAANTHSRTFEELRPSVDRFVRDGINPIPTSLVEATPGKMDRSNEEQSGSHMPRASGVQLTQAMLFDSKPRQEKTMTHIFGGLDRGTQPGHPSAPFPSTRAESIALPTTQKILIDSSQPIPFPMPRRAHANPLRSNIVTKDGEDMITELNARIEAERKTSEVNVLLARENNIARDLALARMQGQAEKPRRIMKGCWVANKVLAVGRSQNVLTKKRAGEDKTTPVKPKETT